MSLTTCIWWVMSTMVRPSRALRSLSRARIDRVVRGSSALVASSHSSTSGSPISARAMATRCCWPPESCRGYALALSAIPTSSSRCMAFARASLRDTFSWMSGRVTLSSTVLDGIRLKCWKIIAILRRSGSSRPSPSVLMVVPLKVTVPLVGRCRTFIVRTSVDFPAPEKPMMPYMEPLLMVRDTSSTARKRFLPRPNSTVTWSSEIRGAPAATESEASAAAAAVALTVASLTRPHPPDPQHHPPHRRRTCRLPRARRRGSPSRRTARSPPSPG